MLDYMTLLVTAPGVLAAVNIIKRYGLPDKWAPLMAILVGGIFGALASYLQTGGFESLPAAIITGLITGLTASGVYDVAVTVGSNQVAVGSADVVGVAENVESAESVMNVAPGDSEPEA